MTGNQKEQINKIIERWHRDSVDGIPIQQAVFDIGVLCGIIMSLDEQLTILSTPTKSEAAPTK